MMRDAATLTGEAEALAARGEEVKAQQEVEEAEATIAGLKGHSRKR